MEALTSRIAFDSTGALCVLLLQLGPPCTFAPLIQHAVRFLKLYANSYRLKIDEDGKLYLRDVRQELLNGAGPDVRARCMLL